MNNLSDDRPSEDRRRGNIQKIAEKFSKTPEINFLTIQKLITNPRNFQKVVEPIGCREISSQHSDRLQSFAGELTC